MYTTHNMYSYFEIFAVTSIILKIVIFLWIVWIRRRLIILSYKLPGPLYVPFIGNLHNLLFQKGNLFEKINSLILKNEKDFRFWFGPKLIVVLRNDESIQKILNVATSEDLNWLQINGSKTDERWKLHKKIMKSAINVKFIIESIPIFESNINQCIIKLDNYCGKESFDIFEILKCCFADITGGERLATQNEKNVHLIEDIEISNQDRKKRLLYSWLHINLLYKFTKSYNQSVHAKQAQDIFVEDAIRKSWERRKLIVFGDNNVGDNKESPVVDKIGEFIEHNPDVIENEEFRDYLIALFSTCYQSLSTITAYCCVCFGMFPEFQQKALEEIDTVITVPGAGLKYEDLYKLKYLDMCIQDVLRLVTVKPYIFRNFTKSVKMDNLNIPPECTVVIPSHVIHRDTSYFRFPEHFFPDHFSCENVKARNIPNLIFGSGTRECPGKLLSTVGIKVALVHILKKYQLEAKGKFLKFELAGDLTSRPTNGFKILLQRRDIIVKKI